MTRALPTTARLWLAAGFCLLPMGTQWSGGAGHLTLGSSGVVLPGFCNDYGYCTPDTSGVGAFYSSGSSLLVSQSRIGPLLVLAAALLAVCAARLRTRATRRIARAATALIAVSAVLAIPVSTSAVWAPLLLALALSGPPVWRPTRVVAR